MVFILKRNPIRLMFILSASALMLGVSVLVGTYTRHFSKNASPMDERMFGVARRRRIKLRYNSTSALDFLVSRTVEAKYSSKNRSGDTSLMDRLKIKKGSAWFSLCRNNP